MIIDRYFVFSIAYDALTLLTYGICAMITTVCLHIVHRNVKENPHIIWKYIFQQNIE